MKNRARCDGGTERATAGPNDRSPPTRGTRVALLALEKEVTPCA
jgi:hypothetical protein